VLRKPNRRRIATLAISSLLIRLLLMAAFIPLGVTGSVNAAGSNDNFETVFCVVHGPMQLAATDGSGEESDQSSDKPRFCPVCSNLIPLAWVTPGTPGPTAPALTTARLTLLKADATFEARTQLRPPARAPPLIRS